ncbi:hypothetical protein GP486_005116, partial [Trichoglossum hirsutum]
MGTALGDKPTKTPLEFTKWDTVPRAPSSPTTPNRYSVLVPCGVLDDPTEGIRNETLTLHRKDVLSIFNPILNACDNHIQTELAAMKKLPNAPQPPPRIATFVLAGGLSNSPVAGDTERDSHHARTAGRVPRVSSRLVCYLPPPLRTGDTLSAKLLRPLAICSSSITAIGAIEAHRHHGFLAKTESKFTLAIAFWTPWHDASTCMGHPIEN